ncbi:efflux RND transporter permease subunit [Arabiibacter massiliensis]|uniref:efflux RND transporter permease subunit n=1 Tax=Arabiibacter massiliensis TaxID=1870985 RepID=UPI0009B9AA70|nr:MMPL family transporter [Arabiibacter massiliensis]
MDRIINGIIAQRKAVVATFLAVAVVCAAMIPFVGVNYDMVDYLPDEAQSTTAVALMNDEFTQAVPNANVLVHDVGLAEALALKEKIAAVEGVEGVMWLDDVMDTTVPLEMADASTVEAYYRDGSALFQVTVAEGAESSVVPALRALVDAAGPGNAVSGEASDTAQVTASTAQEAGGAALILVPIILLLLVLSTTSWIEPVLFIAAIGVSILINMGTNIVLGQVSFITFSVSPILQLAVSLDYAIFLLHAFADERRLTADVDQAMARAMRRSLSTVAASAVTTLFGFAALAFMQFQIGADLGINLVKGIVFSFFTVMVFLPAVTLTLYKLIDKTRHRPLMPSFENVGAVLAKVRVPALVLVLALVVPAFLGQAHTVFTYQNSEPDPNLRAGADTLMIQDEFGQQNAVAVLVPRGDIAAEAALSADLAEVDHVTSVISYASAVGAAIPQGFLDQAVVDQFYSPNYARIIAYTDTDTESDEAFATVEAIQQTAARHYGTYYTAGQSANLYDMKNIVAVDNVVVAAVAVVAILLVLLATFRSLTLPLVLLLAIESGIWINLSIPYFMGESVNFIGYLVINTVQLGATIDYGILLTTHYLRQRKRVPAREAARLALGETFKSLLVSASILATAGFALGFASSMSAVSSLGLLLARGALLSLALVTCFLPALLVLLDPVIRRTTWHAGFAPAAPAPLPEPEGGES